MKSKQEYIKTVILNLTADLQRLPLPLLNNMRGRSRIKYGMTSLCNNGGFTLIELLVVVLIISILAAVAVPQYKKVVEKTKASQATALLEKMKQGATLFEIQNGTWPANFEALDITVPADFKPTQILDGIAYFPRQALSNGDWTLQLSYNNTQTFTGNCHKTISMVRSSGPYEGAGFIYCRCGCSGTWNRKTWCFEPTSWEATRRGSYCKKIMGNKNTHIVGNYAFI